MSEVTLKLFKSTIPSCQYITAAGKYLYFRDGRLATDDAGDIAELEAAIAAKHPHIYISKGEESITAEVYQDPLAAIKKKAIEEYLRDMGNSDKSAGAGAGITTSAALTNLKESNTKK